MSDTGALVVADLGKYFTSFTSNNVIDAMSMTKLSGGTYVIVANSRSSMTLGLTNHLNIITTTDFKTFSTPWTSSTPFGAGHSVKLAQPGKNGSDPFSELYMFHGGDLYQPSGLIEYTQFRYYRMVVN